MWNCFIDCVCYDNLYPPKIMPILEKYWFTNLMNITPCKPHFVVHMLLMIMMAHLRPNREQEKLNHWRFFFPTIVPVWNLQKMSIKLRRGRGKKSQKEKSKGNWEHELESQKEISIVNHLFINWTVAPLWSLSLFSL